MKKENPKPKETMKDKQKPISMTVLMDTELYKSIRHYCAEKRVKFTSVTRGMWERLLKGK